MPLPTTPVSPVAAGASAADDLLGAVGARIAAARRERGLTLAVVADRSGVSPAYVSQIESGSANPTVRALSQIATAVGTDVPTFFGAAAGADADFAPAPSFAALAQSVAGSPGVWDHSAPGSTRLAARIVHGDAADHAAPTTHAGEEYVLVLRGSCVVHVDDARFPLAVGDACHFPAGRVHHLSEASTDLTLSVVMSPA